MDRSLDRSVQIHQGLESALIEIEDGIPIPQTSELCSFCGKEFFDHRPRVKYCSDDCRSIARRQRTANSIRRNREDYFRARKKLDRCSTPRCKNKVSKELPDGTPVCRTCMMKHNVYGGVNKPSPTTPSTGKGLNQKKGAGFAYKSAREEEIDAKIDWDSRWNEVKYKRRKQWFAIGKKLTGKDVGTKAYKDFRKDGGLKRGDKK